MQSLVPPAPVNRLSAATVAVTVNELLKKEMRRGCLARVAGIFFLCVENRAD